MPFDEHDLISCGRTAPHVPLLDPSTVAREAEFAAASSLPHEYGLLRDAGMTDTEMRRRFADEGIALGEVDGGDSRPPNDLSKQPICTR